MQLPRITPYTLKENAAPSWAAFAVQRALNSFDAGLVEDAVFGQRTKQAVMDFQAKHALIQDGIAGGQTQTRIVRLLSVAADPDGICPDDLVDCHVAGESGRFIAAVNWNVAGGVDCGASQRRVYTATWKQPWPDYGALFDDDDLKRAFDTKYQLGLLVRGLRSNHDRYLLGRNKDGTFKFPAARTHERAWRLAVCHHNYPSGADQVAAVGINGLSSYYTKPQTWVKDINARFSDGAPVTTPLEWMQRYSLGSPEHNDSGFMVSRVSDWSTRS